MTVKGAVQEISPSSREGIEDLRAFEKESEITKDDLHRGQEEIQKLTDRFIREIDEMLKVKEKELMEV